jgi:hypothetical protein
MFKLGFRAERKFAGSCRPVTGLSHDIRCCCGTVRLPDGPRCERCASRRGLVLVYLGEAEEAEQWIAR